MLVALYRTQWAFVQALDCGCCREVCCWTQVVVNRSYTVLYTTLQVHTSPDKPTYNILQHTTFSSMPEGVDISGNVFTNTM